MRRGLLAVEAADLVYDLVITPAQLPAATEAAASLTDLTFVLDHLGKPPIAAGLLEPWATDLRAFAGLPNTVAKLSGLVTEADWYHWTLDELRRFTDVALAAFGPDRLFFGSDRPVSTLAADYARVVETSHALLSGLSLQEQMAVLGGNAAGVYGL